MRPEESQRGIHRREFLRRGAMAGLGLGLLSPASGRAAVGADPPRVRRSVPLGRTGLEIPDIGFGGSDLRGGVDLVLHALDRGITYFDTAETYASGFSERTLGLALRGKRDRVILASKVKCGPKDSQEKLMGALEGSLRRLRTDHLDIYFNHAVNDVARLKNPAWYEFVNRAKKQGKIRFSGVSGHGGRLIECLEYALDHDPPNVLLVAYNFGQDPAFYQKLVRGFDFIALQPGLPRVLAKAREKGVGVIAMKALRGARLNDMRPYETGGATFAQAALRWVLTGGHVDSLIVTMRSEAQVDEYLGASGWKRPRSADLPLLARYEERNGKSQCRYGCSACIGSCPVGVPIPEVLRTRMYATDYQDLELARGDYALLGAGASPCVSCADRTCADACPFGLPIAKLAAATHRTLTSGG